MPTTLTSTSIIARKIIRFSIYGLIFIIVARVTIGLGIKIYRNFIPEPPPPPTCAFGDLPPLPFPQEDGKYAQLTFNLETPDGNLPDLAEQAKVYFMPKKPPTIQGLEFAKQKAVSLGFRPDGRALVETVFLYRHNTAPSTLTMNIVSGIFSISYDLRANLSVIDNIPPEPDSATSQVRSYLARADLLEDDLSGPVTHGFIKIQEGRFVETVSLSESDLIKVNIFRKSLGDLPNVTLEPKEANVWFMLSGAKDRENQVIAAEYHYYPLDEKKKETYPLITSQQAWDNLTKGESFIANPDKSGGENIVIRKIYLAHYDAGQYTPFYQPVVVFEGDNDFVAYVPAVNICE
jgi:hypothetical protein